MGKDSGIEWTLRMELMLVAFRAKGNSIFNHKAKFRMCRERLDVMRSQVSASEVTAHLTGEFIPRENIEPPTLVVGSKSFSTSLFKSAIFKAAASRSAWCLFARALTNQFPSFDGMLLSGALPITSLSKTHFQSRFRRHLSAFHRRNECCSSF